MIDLARADTKRVRALFDHLRNAFNAFADSPGEPLGMVDVLMGCHNFYKLIILDLEEKCGGAEGPMILRRTAVDTLAQALGVPTESVSPNL